MTERHRGRGGQTLNPEIVQRDHPAKLGIEGGSLGPRYAARIEVDSIAAEQGARPDIVGRRDSAFDPFVDVYRTVRCNARPSMHPIVKLGIVAMIANPQRVGQWIEETHGGEVPPYPADLIGAPRIR